MTCSGSHCNCTKYKANLRVLCGDYESRAIRPFALGQVPRSAHRYAASSGHAAVIRYADNAAGHLNENYAREIMELHTMGVGSGYTQQDWRRSPDLTGVGIDLKPEDPKSSRIAIPAMREGPLNSIRPA